MTRMNKLLLLLCACMALVASAHAALDGWDNKPGDPCTAAEEGHTRRNASADLDSSEITLICDGTQWQSATGTGGLAALQGQDDNGPCIAEKAGLIRYRDSGNPHWEYCHGGTTSWLPFRLPQCQDDDAGVCTLLASRIANDPQFKPSSIRCGDKLLGVTGTYGSGSSAPFTFTDVSNAALSTLTTASAVTISGIPAGCPGEVFVSGQGNPQISINGGTWSTTGNIANGQTLAVRLTSSASFSTAHTATISIGSTEDSWSVTTLAADTTPSSFTFTDVTNAELSSLTASNTITISGINISTPVSVTGTGAQISINGGGWVTSGNITNGQTLAVRLTSSASFHTAMTATVNVGGVTDSWSVTTRAANNCTAASKTWLTNCTATVSGANHGTNGTASIANPGGCGTSYYGSGTFACSDGSFTYSSGSCTQQTACDTTPNAFTFTDVTGQALNTLITSNTVTIGGINTGTPVSVTGTGAQISINGGTWTTSGNITNGQTLAVRLTSSASFSTAMTATVNVGGVTDSWSVTTLAASYEDQWVRVANTANNRVASAGALLGDGRALICTGTQGGTDNSNRCDIYNPATDTFTSAANSPLQRRYAEAVSLADGRVMLCGGTRVLSSLSPEYSRCDVYSGTSNTWTRVADMPITRQDFILNRLLDGRVLACGGFRYTARCDIYNPDTNSWAQVANLPVGRYGMAGATLPSGDVLICGGYQEPTRCDKYNPTTNTWSLAANMPQEHYLYSSAVLLSDGRMLVCGGMYGGSYTNRCDAYDVTANVWDQVADLPEAKGNHVAVGLSDGRVC